MLAHHATCVNGLQRCICSKGLYLACKVKQGMHLHQVVLNGGTADDDVHSNRDLLQALHQLHFGVFDLVALQISRCTAGVDVYTWHSKQTKAEIEPHLS